MKQRLTRLDALRGVAAGCVVASHCLDTLSVHYKFGFGTTLFNIGYFGVCLFFLISGLLIPISLENVSLLEFWIRRIFRLYPVYWMSLFGAILLKKDPISWIDVIANATMIPIAFNSSILLTVYWTLSLELVFYILISLFRSYGILRYVIIIITVLLLIALGTDNYWPYIVDARRGDSAVWFASNLGMLFTGVWIGSIWRGYQAPVWQYILCINLWLLNTFSSIYIGNGGWAIARVLAGIVFLLVLRSKWIPNRLLIFSGTISYSLYLVHLLIIDSLLLSSPTLSILLWISFSVAAAYILYRYIERPGIALGKHFSNKYQLPS